MRVAAGSVLAFAQTFAAGGARCPVRPAHGPALSQIEAEALRKLRSHARTLQVNPG